MKRDVTLTCDKKPTWVRLIYSTRNNNWQGRTGRLMSKKRICSSSPGNPWSQSRRRKGRLWWESFAEKESFKPGVKEWRDDGWEWWVDGTDGGSATHTTGWGRMERLVRGWWRGAGSWFQRRGGAYCMRMFMKFRESIGYEPEKCWLNTNTGRLELGSWGWVWK